VPTTLIEAPQSDATLQIDVLGSIDAYDAVLNDDYAFVIYKETEKGSGAWRVRIRARHLTGVVFEPEAMRMQARGTGAQGKPYFTWGNGIDPSAGDARSLQYRVHVKDGKPSQIEIALTLRKADGSADSPVSLSVPWPAA
jgi:hypothetical protein